MRRILFVDDEQSILDGLRDLLRKERWRWEMVFVPSGQAALAELEKAAFDVIVSDMRMPGMDGAALLRAVREGYPRILRIILSGHAEREAVERGLPVAQQFLSKPCDAELLRAVLERGCERQILLPDERIRDIIGKLEKLPTVPHTYFQLTQAVARPEAGIGDVAKIVAQDPAMSAKVLQLVNSAYFGLGQHTGSIHQAVTYLGSEQLKALALASHAFEIMGSKAPVEGFSLEQLQQHSVLTARLAKRLSRDPKRAADVFTAALVHDIGKIIFAVGIPDRFAEVVRVVRGTGRPFHVVEKELIGVTHADVGAYLLGTWGLPLPIVEAVAYHHSLSLEADGNVDILAAVHIADALIHAADVGEAEWPREDMLDAAFVERAGLTAELPRWRAIAAEEFRVTGDEK